jgi:hypothetical protein
MLDFCTEGVMFGKVTPRGLESGDAKEFTLATNFDADNGDVTLVVLKELTRSSTLFF